MNGLGENCEILYLDCDERENGQRVECMKNEKVRELILCIGMYNDKRELYSIVTLRPTHTMVSYIPVYVMYTDNFLNYKSNQKNYLILMYDCIM